MPVLHPRRHVAVGVATATVAGLVLALAAAPPAQAVDTSSPVLLNEVYGGGGNSGALYSNDFIELVNTGTTAVDLSTWSVQYGSASGTSWQLTKLTGSIAPGATYLVQEAAGSTVTDKPLPTPDATGTIAMSGTAGKVALATTQTALTGAAPSDATVVDLVGYGAANGFAGSAPAPGQTSALSDQRQNTPAVVNNGENSTDFVAAAPTPDARTAGATGTNCGANPSAPECVPGSTTIQDVQGTGFLSPLDGQTVDKVEGIVTARKSNGFWIQQAAPDTASAASSGVFVFSSTVAPSVGDDVLVSGKVTEYYQYASGENATTTASLSVTEITAVSAVTTRSRGNAVPAALAITPTTVPAVALATPPSGSTNIEAITTVDPTRSAQEFWEAHEGMLVSVDDARVVGPGKPQYNEIYVTTKPEENRNSSGGSTILGYDQSPAGRLLVAPVTGTVPAANVGDVLTGTTSGPVDWSTFGGYDIAATTLGTYQDNHLQPNVAPAQAADQLAVATYNVENLAPSDADSKYARLAQGIVTDLASPDVISVEEIQDNTGATDNGVVAADQTIAKLVAAVTAAGGPAYSSTEIDPVNDQDGGQPGGNIRVVFLYNPDRVGFTPKAPAGDPSTTAVTVTTGADGTPSLSANPGRVDPTNSAWNSSRKPLAAEFTFQGQKVVVVGNHFNSKGGDQNSDGRFQPPTRSSETQRTAQANVLKSFVQQVQAADADAHVVLAGDFNDYQFSAPVKTLTNDGALLTDLINTLPPVERYTYNFNGVSQVLDHIFVTTNLAESTDYTVVHSNAEFSDQASDHDPQVARIRLGTPEPTTKKITLLNINDFHGRIDTNTVKFAGTIEQQRAAAGADNTVFLSAGDNIGASLFASSSQQDNPTIDVLNALGLQASAVGNHEFDQGFADLTGRVADRANWDYLGANVYLKGTQTPALPEYKIIDVDGVKLGVIGAVTQETPSLVAPSGISTLDFGNPVQAVNRVAAQLTDGDESNGEADVLVAEYHAGAVDSETPETDLATEVAKGGEFADIVNNTSASVAAIWTGHTHRTYTFDAPVPGESGKTRPIVQTGEYGNNIGNITLTVNTADDSVASYTATLVPRTTAADADLVAAYPRVAQVKTIVDAAIAKANEIGSVPVGSVTQDITRAYSAAGEDRGAESTLGNLVGNALREELSSSDRGSAQIGVVNPGGLRADLTYASTGLNGDVDGQVSYSEANAVLPFGNRLFTLSLTGAQFKQVLEQQFQPAGSSRPFLDLGLSDNVSYTYDPSAAAGSRITSVTVNGRPLGLTNSYRIATFSFLADGGDNFTAFQGATNVQDTTLVDRDAWVDYLQNNPGLSPSFAKRGVVVSPQPSAVGGGSTVSFAVNTLDLTSKGSPANTTLTATVDGVVLGRFPVSGGATTVPVTIPRTLSGAKVLVLSATPTGTTVRIPLTVSKPGTVAVTGGRTYAAGDSITATLAGWTPGDRVTVRLGGTDRGVVKISAQGKGKLTFPLPVSTPAGSYDLTAVSATTGATAAPVALTVLAKPFQAGSMSVDRSVVVKSQSVTVTLTGWSPGVTAALTLDGTTPLTSVTTDADGRATTKVAVKGTAATVGNHRIVATAPDGSSVSVNISVVAKTG